MRTLIFTKRTIKEIIRDPLNLFFGLALPVLLLLILGLISKNIPDGPFTIDTLTPGIAVFGLSFLSIFGGLIVAKDRSSTFLERLYTTPLKGHEMILGYMLPLIPLGVAQSIVCYVVGMIMGCNATPHIMVGILAIVPISIFFIGLGLLAGSIFNEKAVGAAIGSVLPVITAILGGAWMDLSILGEGMETFALCLPFANAIRLEQCIISGSYAGTLQYFLVILAYDVVILLGAVFTFLRQMKKH